MPNPQCLTDVSRSLFIYVLASVRFLFSSNHHCVVHFSRRYVKLVLGLGFSVIYTAPPKTSFFFLSGGHTQQGRPRKGGTEEGRGEEREGKRAREGWMWKEGEKNVGKREENVSLTVEMHGAAA